MSHWPLLLAVATLALSACATARLHDQQALNSVAIGCGMTYGELIQDEAEKRLLIALRSEPSPRQRACVADWAKRNHLKPVFVQMDSPKS